MRIQTVQIVAALLAAVAFIIAFISAGAAVISSLFALIGACALAWLVYTVAKRMLLHRSERNAAATTEAT
jgi:membrane associated rhomboid family serine protease